MIFKVWLRVEYEEFGAFDFNVINLDSDDIKSILPAGDLLMITDKDDIVHLALKIETC